MKKAPRTKNRLPRGITLQDSFPVPHSTVSNLAWSLDGERLAFATDSGDLYIKSFDDGELLHIKAHTSSILSLAWSPDGEHLASGGIDHKIALWHPVSAQKVDELTLHKGAVRCLTWSSDTGHLASGSDDGTVRIWHRESHKSLRILRGHSSWIRSLAWSPSGLLASSSDDRTIRIWTASGTCLRVLEAHSLWVLDIAWSPDGETLASASGDRTLRIWDPQDGNLTEIVEGHTQSVTSVDFSHDGQFLASKALDSSLRLWRPATWEPLGVVEETTQDYPRRGLAFHPSRPVLASVGEGSHKVNIWLLKAKMLKQAADSARSVQYANAKVVLVGDTGVGKSALGLVLSNHKWVPTESTHARHVWTFQIEDVKTQQGGTETRETLLWDLAGQPGYRLIHQLHLHDVALALIVFDARSSIDPFSGVHHWDRALRQSRKAQEGSAVPLRKLLVSARTDRGGLAVGRARLEKLVQELGLDGYHKTSAKTGEGVEELRRAIHDSVDWDALPRVISTKLFQDIKAFLVEEKKFRRPLARAADLFRLFCEQSVDDSKGSTRADFDTCVGRLESRGLIHKLSFGDLILLQPELLDSYASAIVNAARDEPEGAGCILEEEVLGAAFPIPDPRVKDEEEERLLLIATIRELLRHEIALREESESGSLLAFPSEFTRDWPKGDEPDGLSMVFRFKGVPLNIYSTLVVRLSRSGLFFRKDFWRNAALFRTFTGEECGLLLRPEIEEGEGELLVFFGATTSEATSRNFESYVEAHLERRAIPGTVDHEVIFLCPDCKTPVTRLVVQRRRKKGFDSLSCPVCGADVDIKKRPTRRPKKGTDAIQRMDRSANQSLEKDLRISALQGKIETGDFDVFLCYNGQDREEVEALALRLKQNGILPWLDEWELRPGLPWQDALEEQIPKIKSAAVFVGPAGIGPWEKMELKAFLRQFIDRKCPVIPVLLATAPDKVNLPGFLGDMTWVDFRKKEPNPLARLVWGITGEKGPELEANHTSI